MNLQVLANIGEFVGGIGVILSLIYVAIQVRGNTRSQRNDIEARALERLASMQRELAANEDLNRIFMRCLLDPRSVSAAERVRYTWYMTEFFSAMEFLLQQYEQRNFDEANFQRWELTIRWWLTFPGIIDWWRCKPTPFRPDFEKYVEKLITLGYQQPNLEQWNAYLAGEPLSPTPA
jgi:hypothetical protein